MTPRISAAQRNPIAAFRALHETACFILPNPWDAGSAAYLQSLGFKALATTSAGAAFADARSDDPGAMPLEETLAHIALIVRSTSLPVNADFQSGHADNPEQLAANVQRCLATGVAGLSIEDNSGNDAHPLYARELAIERMKAARAGIDASGSGAVLTGRCEAWLVDAPDALRVALDRLVGYAEAGADCLYAPGVSDPKEIAEIVRAVAPKPVNVLVSRPHPELTFARLRDLGVRRISVGSALALAAWGGFLRAAKSLAESNSFAGFAGNAAYGELNDFFRARRLDEAPKKEET